MNCDYCENPATCNYQKIWVRYTHNAKTFHYSKHGVPDHTGLNDDPSGEDNVHLCKECEPKWLNGEL